MNLELAFVLLTLLVNVFLVFIGFKAIDKTSNTIKKHKTILVAGLIIWQLFIYFLTSTGLLKTYAFPPFFAIAFIFPSFIFTGIFLFKNRNKDWINSIPKHWIIYFQSFRILVEILFVLAFMKNIFNVQVTIEGYNFDMIFAFTAPIVAYFVYQRKVLSEKIALYWNYIGLLVLASVIVLFLTSVYLPQLYNSDKPLLPLKAFDYPYVLIAGFLMPAAVFLHILSIVQITRK